MTERLRTGRVVLLALSPRVAPGLLSWPAWDAVRTADVVVATDAEHPHRVYVEDAGVSVTVLVTGSARELAGQLLQAAQDQVVVLLGGPDGDPGLAEALAEMLAVDADAGRTVPTLELLAGSHDLPGARLLDVVTVMDRLRSPGGCPWDREQTHASLVRYLLEEAYETVETVETGDLVGLQEELGDLLLQVAFHARIGEEHPDAPWSIDSVASGIVDKLVGRHPHVFADGSASSAADVEASWETIKLAEKGRTSAVEGVPLSQPALALADKLLSRASKAGLDVPVPHPGAELAVDLGSSDEVGALLLSVVARARAGGVDAEAALRAAARDYARRIQVAEGQRAAQGG
jgi:XTP/dITP diphosphohydrolase